MKKFLALSPLVCKIMFPISNSILPHFTPTITLTSVAKPTNYRSPPSRPYLCYPPNPPPGNQSPEKGRCQNLRPQKWDSGNPDEGLFQIC